MAIHQLFAVLRNASDRQAADYFLEHPRLAPFLDRLRMPGARGPIIDSGEDEVVSVTRGYGKDGTSRPTDYLESFREFITENINTLPALVVVAQRPRDLTRDELRKLKLLLDQEGFSEASVQRAWKDVRDEDVAATIIGYIRQVALGAALEPYEQRVERAVARIRKRHTLSDNQLKWLERIAQQLKLETVVDRASLDRGQFQTVGGFASLNRKFDGKLEALLGELAEEIWKEAG